MGALILAGRERRVVSVEQHAGRGETDVCLCEDVADLMMHIDAAAHLACVELMKRDWWEIEKEALRVCLRERIGLHAVG
ncbi:hypothetical protein [Sorangium sp. So ce1078]|uniref:hypothetical protein n=1 Tax=Sorangium sp. So ce1078 TaxID=3133329 RepID=UPI003F5DECFA